jgi:hypothetical protein
MERTVLAIHLIPSFVVFAFADCRPFRLAKGVTHNEPFAMRLRTISASPKEPPNPSALGVTAQPQAPGDLLRTRSEGPGERSQFRIRLSQADTGSLRDVRRTLRFECVPSV